MKQVIAALVCIACSPHLCAQEPELARLPYKTLYDIVTVKLEKIRSRASGSIGILVTSSLPDVADSDITLYIDSHKGHLGLVRHSDGLFRLPLDKELADENPDLVANQPKGSLHLDMKVIYSSKSDIVKVLKKKNTVRYSQLFDTTGHARVVDKIIDDGRDAGLSASLGEPHDFVYLLKPVTTAPAVIHDVTGDKLVHPDGNRIRLVYDHEMFERDPLVTFPGNLLWQIDAATVKQLEFRGYEFSFNDSSLDISDTDKNKNSQPHTYDFDGRIVAVSANPEFAVIAVFLSTEELVREREEFPDSNGELRDISAFVADIILISLPDRATYRTYYSWQQFPDYNVLDIWSPNGEYAAISDGRTGPVNIYGIAVMKDDPIVVSPKPLSCASAQFYECLRWVDNDTVSVTTVQCGVYNTSHYHIENRELVEVERGNAAKLRCE